MPHRESNPRRLVTWRRREDTVGRNTHSDEAARRSFYASVAPGGRTAADHTADLAARANISCMSTGVFRPVIGPRRPMIAPRPALVRCAAAGLLLLGVSCASVGPKTIPRDQFDYGAGDPQRRRRSSSCSTSCGLRYVDAPGLRRRVLGDQPVLARRVRSSCRRGFQQLDQRQQHRGRSAVPAEMPTARRSPTARSRERSSRRSLLTPISPENLFALVQAGWPPEFILRLDVRSINGVENEWASPAHRKTGRSALRRAVAGLDPTAEGPGARACAARAREKSARSWCIQLDAESLERGGAGRPRLHATRRWTSIRDLREYALSYGLVRRPAGRDRRADRRRSWRS